MNKQSYADVRTDTESRRAETWLKAHCRRKLEVAACWLPIPCCLSLVSVGLVLAWWTLATSAERGRAGAIGSSLAPAPGRI